VSLLTSETQTTESGTDIGIITLNDPDHRNVLSAELIGAMVAALDDFELEDRGIGAIVITGAGRAFCAGANLSNLGDKSRQATVAREQGLRAIYEGFLRVARSPIPTIAAVNGAAVGAGVNLALCCDLRIAATNARFDTRFLTLGLHPGGGHTWMLERLVGLQVATAMVLFGETLPAEAAARHGLVYEVTEPDQLMPTAIRLAGQAASNPSPLSRRVKELLRLPPEEHDTAVTREIEAQMWSLDQPFFAERLAQMQQKISSKS
jgi:enoyl-CoA hydratase